MHTRAQQRQQSERLARGFAADVRQQQDATRALVAELAGVRQPALAGAHARRSLEQLAADSGFSDAGREELAPVLSIGGREFR